MQRPDRTAGDDSIIAAYTEFLATLKPHYVTQQTATANAFADHDNAVMRAFQRWSQTLAAEAIVFTTETAPTQKNYVRDEAANQQEHIQKSVTNLTTQVAAKAAAERNLLAARAAAERQKAKILNFSIAYGKTAYGLANDFGTTQKEAQATGSCSIVSEIGYFEFCVLSKNTVD